MSEYLVEVPFDKLTELRTFSASVLRKAAKTNAFFNGEKNGEERWKVKSTSGQTTYIVRITDVSVDCSCPNGEIYPGRARCYHAASALANSLLDDYKEVE